MKSIIYGLFIVLGMILLVPASIASTDDSTVLKYDNDNRDNGFIYLYGLLTHPQTDPFSAGSLALKNKVLVEPRVSLQLSHEFESLTFAKAGALKTLISKQSAITNTLAKNQLLIERYRRLKEYTNQFPPTSLNEATLLLVYNNYLQLDKLQQLRLVADLINNEPGQAINALLNDIKHIRQQLPFTNSLIAKRVLFELLGEKTAFLNQVLDDERFKQTNVDFESANLAPLSLAERDLRLAHNKSFTESMHRHFNFADSHSDDSFINQTKVHHAQFVENCYQAIIKGNTKMTPVTADFQLPWQLTVWQSIARGSLCEERLAQYSNIDQQLKTLRTLLN